MLHDRTIRVATKRLDLVTMTGDDLPFLHRLLGRPAVVPDGVRVERLKQGVSAAIHDRDYELWYDADYVDEWPQRTAEREAKHGHAFWTAIERATGEPVGIYGPIGLSDSAGGAIEIGWYTAATFRRRGFASEAARACIQWTFENRGVDEVASMILPANGPSAAVAISLGMTRRPAAVEHAGLVHDHYAMRRKEWVDALARSAPPDAAPE